MPDSVAQQQLTHQLQHAADYVLFGGFLLAGEMIFPRFAGDVGARQTAGLDADPSSVYERRLG
jgi:hypothetical protein